MYCSQLGRERQLPSSGILPPAHCNRRTDTGNNPLFLLRAYLDVYPDPPLFSKFAHRKIRYPYPQGSLDLNVAGQAYIHVLPSLHRGAIRHALA